MEKISVFIAEPMNMGWIIEKLMRDLAQELIRIGVKVRIGEDKDYAGEEIYFHSRYLYSAKNKNAKINSLFVTHIDDFGKEFEIKSKFDDFDSFVCMSPFDAEFLVELGCPRRKVIGLNLPHRGGVFKPLKFAIFSAFYSDGRKNEAWLVEYFRTRPNNCKDLIINILGEGWGQVVNELRKLDVSTSWLDYSRSLPGEYELLKSELSNNDFLLYMGFDGGAMCFYDGVNANLKLIIPKDGYHIGYPDSEYYFENKSDFFEILDGIFEGNQRRKDFIQSRSIEVYASTLLGHWRGDNGIVSEISISNVLQARRATYHKLNFRRFFSSIFRYFRKYI